MNYIKILVWLAVVTSVSYLFMTQPQNQEGKMTPFSEINVTVSEG